MKNKLYSLALAITALAIVMGTYTFLNLQQIKSTEQTNRLIAMRELTSVADQLETTLNLDLQFSSFIGFIISNDPNTSDKYLTEISKRILKEHPNISNIAIAPDGIVKFVYPKEENQLPIDHNILEDKTREPFVRRAIETRLSTTQGPVEAVQGGLLIFNREAIFVKEDNEEKFWGMTAVSVDFNKLIEKTELKAKDNEYLFSIRAHQIDGVNDFFWGSSEIFKKNALVKKINLPNQTWDIAIYPKSGWIAKSTVLNSISIFFYLLAALVFVGTYLLSEHYRERVMASRRDFLTKTLSKDAFLNYFNKRTKNTHTKHGVIIMDLNHFKNINDTLGHPVGDGVLIEVARRIERLLKKHDRVSRFAGDEYLIFIDSISTESDLDKIISSISTEVSKTMNICGNDINITIAAGGSVFPIDGTSFAELYKLSDKKMYLNKEQVKQDN